MYESALAAKEYSSSSHSTGSARSIEYQLFAKTTRALTAAGDAGGSGFADMANAVYQNLRLWTAIAADLAHEQNALPAELKSKLFYLFEFTQQHSQKVLEGAATADVLVDINTSVMRGLRGGPVSQEATP